MYGWLHFWIWIQNVASHFYEFNYGNRVTNIPTNIATGTPIKVPTQPALMWNL